MTDDLHRLAAPYALDALDGDERARFEAHLRTCEDCAADVRDFQQTAGGLAAGVSVTPPAHLRASVLAAAASTPQEPRASEPRSGSWSRRLLPAIAAVLALVALGAGVVARGAIVERDRAEELLAVLAAPDARESVLDASGPLPGSVRVVWSAERGAAVLVGVGLEAPDDDQTYELWVLASDGPRSAGIFRPDPDGRIERRLVLPADPADGWGVTIEPAGGSPQPTGDILFLGA
jgi:anti-sigma-K factor RskA